MKIEFLVEDKSGGELIYQIMEHYKRENDKEKIEYNILPYKGIGGIPKRNKTALIKSEQLLNELPKRLRALQFQYLGRADVSIFVIVDNDDKDTAEFYGELNKLAINNMISIDHVFCIAVEEMESWLLGDIEAMQKAYPKVKDRILSKHSGYVQDSICGTWEYLADILTQHGVKEFKKKYRTVYEIGEKKIEWARTIGAEMDIRNNKSKSFMRFLSELDKRVERDKLND